MYNGGNIMSGPQDSLVDLLMPSKTEDLDKVRIIDLPSTVERQTKEYSGI